MDRPNRNPFVQGLLLAGVLTGGCHREPTAEVAEIKLTSAASAEPGLFAPGQASPILPRVGRAIPPDGQARPVAATGPVEKGPPTRPPEADPVRYGPSADPPGPGGAKSGAPLLRRMPPLEEATPSVIRQPAPAAPAATPPALAWPGPAGPGIGPPAPLPAAAPPAKAPAPLAAMPQVAPQPMPRAELPPAAEAPPRRDPYPAPLTPQELAALRPVDLQLQQKLVRAQELAGRGAAWSSRGELLDVLRIVAESCDSLRQSDEFRQALNRGLEALREVEDFTPKSGANGRQMSVAEIVPLHRTPALKEAALANLTPLAAQQHYLSYAQRQLGAAAGGTVCGSAALYGLGRLQDSLAAAPGTSVRSPVAGPRAMALYQAALLADRTNHLAANELGVLLARYGDHASARQILLHSLQTEQQPVTWFNLAIVHDRLGERDLAERARLAGQQLASRRGPSALVASDRVRWVDAATFAAASEEGGWPEPAAAPASSRPAAAPLAKGPAAKPAADTKTATQSNDSGWSFPFWSARGETNTPK